jgi:adenosylhomocysteine nucleosidase
VAATILLVSALAEELDHPGVLHTGMGKLNAAYALTRALRGGPPPALVVNYGTAGGLKPGLSGLVEVAGVLQADMNAGPLAPRGLTPQDPSPMVLSSGQPGVLCGTGDQFVTAPDPWLLEQGVEVVDMELFAIAWVCQREGVPWRAFKFISDHADNDAGTSWQAHLASRRELFLQQLERLRSDPTAPLEAP